MSKITEPAVLEKITMALFTHKNVIVDEFKFKVGQLLQTVEIYARESGDPGYLDKVKNIKLHFQHNDETLEELCYVEKELIGIAPESCLIKYYAQITSRYKEVLPKEAEMYITKNENNGENGFDLKVETFYISILLHKYYHFLENKEKVISQYKLLFGLLLLIMFVVSGLSFLLSVLAQSATQSAVTHLIINLALLIILMICAGYFGAVISIVRRIQGIAEKSVDGINREELLLKLTNGKWGIFLSIVLGTLSPFVLLILIITLQGLSIKSGDHDIMFLPQLCFHLSQCTANAEDQEGTAMSILYGLRFVAFKDLAEFILLSIASGFSERFVPDVLDRVSKELEKKIPTS
jgi:hypothetical protein